MAIVDKRVIRWEHDLSSGLKNTVFIVSDDGAGLNAEFIALASGIYVVDGKGTATDFIDAFETALEAGYNKINTSGGAFAVSLGVDGKITIVNNSALDMWVEWAATTPSGGTTLDPRIAGEAATAGSIELTGSGGSYTSTYQHLGSWYPDRPHVDDTGDYKARNVGMNKNLDKRVGYLEYSDHAAPPQFRSIEWEDIHHARMKDSAAADATAAAAAGITTGDPNASFENLFAHLFEPLFGAAAATADPSRVYIYDEPDPATNTRSAAYQLQLQKSEVDRGGVGEKRQRNDIPQKRFRMKLGFRRE